MKILIVNTYDIQGGAARAAYRLHNSLLNKGVNSKMLVQSKKTGDSTVFCPSSKMQKIAVKIRSSIDQLPVKFYDERTETLFSPSIVPSSNIIKRINEINPDIVHLHWINAGMIRIEDLSKINSPIVWSLHDMYPFTGGCHYDDNCGRFKNNCGNCKVLKSKNNNDISRKIWKRKRKVLDNISNLTIIGLSRWMENQAKKSSLFHSLNVINLPNGIDTNVFKPHSKDFSRNLWNLPKDKKLILFGAMDATSDPRKGYNELLESLNMLNINDTEIIIFGNSKINISQNIRFKTHYLGNLIDDISLVSLYCSVDVMVVPSLQENLSNVIMESLSCGTPVVGFDIGGNSDMIEHKKNGYLANPLDSSDLARGIEWILNFENYDNLLNYSRKKILNEFDDSLVSENYLNLYKQVLKNFNK